MRIVVTIFFLAAHIANDATAYPCFKVEALQSTSGSSPQMADSDTTTTPKKEWIGESGYCNCILVAMSRMQLSKLVLSTEKPLPNLDDLTSKRADTNKWIKAQALKYGDLDRLMVIRMLAESADMGPRKRSGMIRVHDVVGDNGPTVERVFELQLANDGDGLSLTVNQVMKP